MCDPVPDSRFSQLATRMMRGYAFTPPHPRRARDAHAPVDRVHRAQVGAVQRVGVAGAGLGPAVVPEPLAIHALGHPGVGFRREGRGRVLARRGGEGTGTHVGRGVQRNRCSRPCFSKWEGRKEETKIKLKIQEALIRAQDQTLVACRRTLWGEKP